MAHHAEDRQAVTVRLSPDGTKTLERITQVTGKSKEEVMADVSARIERWVIEKTHKTFGSILAPIGLILPFRRKP